MAALSVTSVERTPLKGFYGKFLFKVVLGENIPTSDGAFIDAKSTKCRRVDEFVGCRTALTTTPAQLLQVKLNDEVVSGSASPSLGTLGIRSFVSPTPNAVVWFIGS